MLAAIINSTAERDVWLFYGCRNRHDHALREQIDELNQQHDRTRIVQERMADMYEAWGRTDDAARHRDGMD